MDKDTSPRPPKTTAGWVAWVVWTVAEAAIFAAIVAGFCWCLGVPRRW